jgi:hypothetical protein
VERLRRRVGSHGTYGEWEGRRWHESYDGRYLLNYEEDSLHSEMDCQCSRCGIIDVTALVIRDSTDCSVSEFRFKYLNCDISLFTFIHEYF